MKKIKKSRTNYHKIPDPSYRKQEELIGLLLLIMGILVLIALFTYEPGEKPGNISNLIQVKNGLGIAGVYISDFLIRWTIGFPIFVFPFFIIAWGINRLLGKYTRELLRWTGLTFLFAYLLSVSFALHELMSTVTGKSAFEFSGRFGAFGAQFLVLIFGHYGAVVVLIGIIMIMVLLSTTFSFAEVYNILSSFLLKLLIKTRQLGKKIFKGSSRPKTRIPALVRPKREEYKAEDKFTSPLSPKPDIYDKSQNEYKQEKSGVLSEQLDMELKPEQSKKSIEDIDLEEEKIPVSTKPYELPPLDLLQLPDNDEDYIDEELLQANARMLEDKLADFGITSRVIEIHPGPVITRYELEPAAGIKVSRITALADDLAMAMRAKRIRIVAPIPGKAAVGVELPNVNPSVVYLREILSIKEFQEAESPLTIGFGKTISGKPFIADLAKMPHLLVAGATGSGKSVCLNTIILSFLYKAKPSEVQLILIDPKRLELSNYAKLFRHHLSYVEGSKDKVATTTKSAITTFKSIEQEMERRYELLAGAGVRNIEEYNQRIKEGIYVPENEEQPKTLPYVVIIVDELADLMLTSSASKEVEEPIARLAQMSRAVGIHLILATQRPSVDVITGVIKANFPARIAFQVASKVDSRTILDMNGAEKLLGRGDMLFLPPASPELIRIHNAYIDLNEIESIIEHVRHQAPVEKKPLPVFSEEEEAAWLGFDHGKRDALFEEAMKLVVRHQQGSVSLIQRRLKVGYSRAARIIDELEDAGIVGPFEGSKAREVLVTPEELETLSLDNDEEKYE